LAAGPPAELIIERLLWYRPDATTHSPPAWRSDPVPAVDAASRMSVPGGHLGRDRHPAVFAGRAMMAASSASFFALSTTPCTPARTAGRETF